MRFHSIAGGIEAVARRWPRSGRADAIVGEGNLRVEIDDLELVDTDVVEGLGSDTQRGPLRRRQPVIGEGEGDVATVGEDHPVLLECAQDDRSTDQTYFAVDGKATVTSRIVGGKLCRRFRTGNCWRGSGCERPRWRLK